MLTTVSNLVKARDWGGGICYKVNKLEPPPPPKFEMNFQIFETLEQATQNTQVTFSSQASMGDL